MKLFEVTFTYPAVTYRTIRVKAKDIDEAFDKIDRGTKDVLEWEKIAKTYTEMLSAEEIDIEVEEIPLN